MLPLNKPSRFLCAGLLIASLIGCDMIFSDGEGGDSSTEYVVALSGDSEVPPVDTDAAGEADIEVNEERTALQYSLTVSAIDSVVAAHIHLGGPGENGPVVVPLFDGPATSVQDASVIAEGTVTQADLINELEGQPFQALVDAMENGNAYVNVHTAANPAGEVRGQINGGGDGDESGGGDGDY